MLLNTIVLWTTTLCTTGCVRRYANVYVNAVLPNDTSVGMELYDAKSGLHLGLTPMTLYLQRSGRTRYPPLSLLLRNGDYGCPTYWQIADVANWAKTRSEADLPPEN